MSLCHYHSDKDTLNQHRVRCWLHRLTSWSHRDSRLLKFCKNNKSAQLCWGVLGNSIRIIQFITSPNRRPLCCKRICNSLRNGSDWQLTHKLTNLRRCHSADVTQRDTTGCFPRRPRQKFLFLFLFFQLSLLIYLILNIKHIRKYRHHTHLHVDRNSCFVFAEQSWCVKTFCNPNKVNTVLWWWQICGLLEQLENSWCFMLQSQKVQLLNS